MNIKTITQSVFISAMAAVSFSSNATDFGVNIQWEEAGQQLTKEGLSKFEQMIESGEIKRVFIQEKNDGVKTANFVISAKNKQQVQEKLATLPMYQNQTLDVTNIQPLGDQWLDSSLPNQNYGLSFYWNQDVEQNEMNRVLGLDLQRVWELNQTGVVTSSYINTQQNYGMIKPIYLISVLAESQAKALEMSQQFEAVAQGYVDVDITFLGKQVMLQIDK